MKEQNDIEVCKNCKFSYPETKGFIKCRYYAPQEFDRDYGKFPVMHEKEWCGDFQPKIVDTVL